MEKPDEVQKLIDEINFRKSNPKNYEEMKAEEISKELREIMKFEQESFKKIEEFEKTQKNQDLVQYAKMISSNTTGREIVQLQEVYLRKIDKEFLNKK
jgi:ubiquinone biosynthesis protein Coq4